VADVVLDVRVPAACATGWPTDPPFRFRVLSATVLVKGIDAVRTNILTAVARGKATAAECGGLPGLAYLTDIVDDDRILPRARNANAIGIGHRAGAALDADTVRDRVAISRHRCLQHLVVRSAELAGIHLRVEVIMACIVAPWNTIIVAIRFRTRRAGLTGIVSDVGIVRAGLANVRIDLTTAINHNLMLVARTDSGACDACASVVILGLNIGTGQRDDTLTLPQSLAGRTSTLIALNSSGHLSGKR